MSANINYCAAHAGLTFPDRIGGALKFKHADVTDLWFNQYVGWTCGKSALGYLILENINGIGDRREKSRRLAMLSAEGVGIQIHANNNIGAKAATGRHG